MAALLACGTAAVLSHQSAASLWNLIPYPAPGDVCVTVPPERSATRPRIEFHRARLHRRDIRHRHRLALTSPPRTILDLAASWAEEDLERIVAEAHYRHLASDEELCAQCDRNPNKRGTARLRASLDLPGGPRRTRSPAERDMLRLLRERGVSGFEVNTHVHGYEVDFLFPAERLVVEIDGFDAHSGRVAFERDRLKRAALIARGLNVMAVTGGQIRRDPNGVLDRVRQALAA
jgi:very-short-patch-repair endonuclease